MTVVHALAPQSDALLAEIDALRDEVASGRLRATTLLVVTRDRVAETSGWRRLGEPLPASHLAGLLMQAAVRVVADSDAT